MFAVLVMAAYLLGASGVGERIAHADDDSLKDCWTQVSDVRFESRGEETIEVTVLWEPDGAARMWEFWRHGKLISQTYFTRNGEVILQNRWTSEGDGTEFVFDDMGRLVEFVPWEAGERGQGAGVRFREPVVIEPADLLWWEAGVPEPLNAEEEGG